MTKDLLSSIWDICNCVLDLVCPDGTNAMVAPTIKARTVDRTNMMLFETRFEWDWEKRREKTMIPERWVVLVLCQNVFSGARSAKREHDSAKSQFYWRHSRDPSGVRDPIRYKLSQQHH